MERLSQLEEVENVLKQADEVKVMAQKILSQPSNISKSAKHKKIANPKQVLVNSSMTNLPIKQKFIEKSPYAPDHSIYKQNAANTQQYQKSYKHKQKKPLNKNESQTRIGTKQNLEKSSKVV